MMGDITGTKSLTSENEDAAKQSIDILKETKELSDITKAGEKEEVQLPTPTISNDNESESKGKKAPMSIDMVFKSATIDTVDSSACPSINLPPGANEISNSQVSARSGRMNKLRDHASNIFPIGVMGCKDDETLPSPRRLLDAQEASQDSIGHIENTPRKMSAKISHDRNPVLGTGVESVDQIKPNNSKSKKLVDGNPVLGEGYQDPMNRNASSTRIPPGGYSHGLW